MTLKLYSLYRLIETQNRERLLSLLSTFKCQKDGDCENYLKNKSVEHELKNISRTYLVVETDENEVRGYFTLAMKCLFVKDAKLEYDIRESMNIDRDIAQSYLIGQLARSDNAEPGLGRSMLDNALKIISEGKVRFGCGLVRLDCKDGLIKYYESCGFTAIGKNKKQTLNQMIQFI